MLRVEKKEALKKEEKKVQMWGWGGLEWDECEQRLWVA